MSDRVALPSSTPTPPPQPRRRRPSRQDTLNAIQNSVPHRLKLQHFRKEMDYYRSLVDSQEELCRLRTTEMYQLLGIFAVFQGVLVSAISQATVLTCGNIWSPISLSVTACVTTVWAVLRKLHSISDLKLKAEQNKERGNAIWGKMEEINLKGMDFDFNAEPDEGMAELCKEGVRRALSVYEIAVTTTLVTFTGLFVVCAKLVCRGGCQCQKNL